MRLIREDKHNCQHPNTFGGLIGFPKTPLNGRRYYVFKANWEDVT